MKNRTNKNFKCERGGRFSKPRPCQAPSSLGARGPLRVPWSSLAPATAHTLDISNQLKNVKLHTFSLNTGKRACVSMAMFQPEFIESAQSIVSTCGGNFASPAGECRAKITCCCGSALISLHQLSWRKALGIAVVTWSDVLAHFAWGELWRAYEESAPRLDTEAVRCELSQTAGLPRMATLMWPAIEERADEETLFLIASTFWLVGWTVATRKFGAQSE